MGCHARLLLGSILAALTALQAMRLLVSITQTRNLHAYNPEALVTDLKVR